MSFLIRDNVVLDTLMMTKALWKSMDGGTDRIIMSKEGKCVFGMYVYFHEKKILFSP